jgi:hypothetical protein
MPSVPMPATYTSSSSYEDPRDHRAEQVQEFLKKMGLIESTNNDQAMGKPTIAGTTPGAQAVGKYQLMPATAQDIDRNSNINSLDGLDAEQVTQRLKEDPDLQERLSSTMASKLLQHSTPEEAAYKWQMGQYSKPTAEDLANNQNAKKFRVLNGVK